MQLETQPTASVAPTLGCLACVLRQVGESKPGFFAIASAPDPNNAGVVELLIKEQPGSTAELLCQAKAGGWGRAGRWVGWQRPVLQDFGWVRWRQGVSPGCVHCTAAVSLAQNACPELGRGYTWAMPFMSFSPKSTGLAGDEVLVSPVMGKGFPVDRVPPATHPTLLLFATGSGVSPIKVRRRGTAAGLLGTAFDLG